MQCTSLCTQNHPKIFAVNNNRVDRKLPSVTPVGFKNELVMLESKLTLASASERISMLLIFLLNLLMQPFAPSGLLIDRVNRRPARLFQAGARTT